jgi:hypothetical protein
MALLACVGVDEEGFREVLAVEVAGSEQGVAYASLLRGLVDRGLKLSTIEKAEEITNSEFQGKLDFMLRSKGYGLPAGTAKFTAELSLTNIALRMRKVSLSASEIHWKFIADSYRAATERDRGTVVDEREGRKTRRRNSYDD